MKKLLVLLAVVTASASVASAQTWGVGARTGSWGFEALGQYAFANDNYVEARLGLSWFGGFGVDFTALYNWNVANFDWTRGHGNWFLDVGAGLNVGGFAHYFTAGAAGMARLGYTFENFPLSLGFDWTPVIGVGSWYGKGYEHSKAHFNPWGLANLGISAVYRF